MIALLRKNLASSHTAFVCNSPFPFALPLHFSSASLKIHDLLLHKHHFSLESATLITSRLAQSRSPERAESVLSFFKESGFSSAQMEKILKNDPPILSARVDLMKSKLRIIQGLGFSSKDVAEMITSYQVILSLSAENKIIPTIALLKGLLGSDYDVVRVIRRCHWVLSSDLERTLMPNIEILKSCGIPMERILKCFYCNPRWFLIKPDVMRKSVDKAKEMGVSPSANVFVHAVQSIASLGIGAWEVRLQDFLNMGFSEREILTMFQKAPQVFVISKEKVEKIMELLLARGKFNLSSIVNAPVSLTYSLEKRYKPRLRILGILESKNLIDNWPSLVTIHSLTDDKFSQRFVKPYLNEVGEVWDKRDCKSTGAKYLALGKHIGAK